MNPLLLALTLAITPAERDSLLEKTPGNEAFWAEVLELEDPYLLEAVETLFTQIARLDRLEMTEEVLMDHVLGAQHSRGLFYTDLPDSIFLPYLLHYRLDEEPVSAYRTRLSVFWQSRLPAGATLEETCRAVWAWMRENLELYEPEFMGGVAAPGDVIGAGGGTEREWRVLLGASLKALGIAARPVQGCFGGPDGGLYRWLEVWDGGSWEPFVTELDSLPGAFEGLAMAICFTDEVDLTGEYVPTGTLVIEGLPDTLPGDWSLGIAVPRSGALEPLDWSLSDPLATDSAELGVGEYLVQLGLRKQSGAVLLWVGRVELSAGRTTRLCLSWALEEMLGSPMAPVLTEEE
ncbi:transglutaminase domain-containing protein [Candidatus Fermentibacterales bacterium]|nr:transglutaminase domain-containing protein [Candidatus Fermentibacterales bacterium]